MTGLLFHEDAWRTLQTLCLAAERLIKRRACGFGASWCGANILSTGSVKIITVFSLSRSIPAVAFSICFQEQNKIQGDKPNIIRSRDLPVIIQGDNPG